MNGVQQMMISRKTRLGQRTSRDEDLWAVASGASQKSYLPSPDAGSQRRKVFGDLHSRSPVHAGAQDEEGYGGDTVERRGKILTPIRLILVKAHRLYIQGSQRPCVMIGSIIRLENRLDLSYLVNLKAKKPKNKSTKGSHAPARGGAKFWRTIHAHVALPSPQPERGERACVWSFLSLPHI